MWKALKIFSAQFLSFPTGGYYDGCYCAIYTLTLEVTNNQQQPTTTPTTTTNQQQHPPR